jgi:hypothetical protein
MPVIDHPVHAHGVRDAEHRYGCWGRAPFREMVTGSRGQQWPHRMSRECRYDRSLSDSACAGCCHAGSGERYAAEQQQRIKRKT